MISFFKSADASPTFDALATLILRLGFGGTMLLSHGWPKFMAYSEKSGSFGDPLGIGSPLSMALAVFAEVFCSALVVVGIWTRFAIIPLLVTMCVAFFLVHGADPWQRKELAFMYLVAFAALLVKGPGKYSLDARR